MRKWLHALALISFCLASGAAFAADKPYVREDLASDAIRLEEKLKKDAFPVSALHPIEQIRKDAAQRISRGDPKGALPLLATLITSNPKSPDPWLAYAKAAFVALNSDESGYYALQENALAAAYTAYQRAKTPAEEASALTFLGEIYGKKELWRLSLNAYRASLDKVDNAALRATFQEMREKYGFRILDYKVDSDAASPRVCFQFSEPLARGKVDFAPFITQSGAANAAISSEDQQLCVEGLKHGERYAMVVRQGLPSSVGENLLKSADYEIYVRDRSPQVHFTGKNYVLPRLGQEGVPVVSVNTPKISVDILRIGDRNLLPTVRSEDFLGQLSGYKAKKLADGDAVKIWSGTLDAKPDLNRDVTTAFPVLEAVGKLEPGVYVMLAQAGEHKAAVESDDEDSGRSATQWFVVSDLGLTAFTGTDGIHVLVRSLATAAPLENVELRLIARSNEILATRPTPADGHVRFDPGLARGTGGLAPGLIVATDANGDYGFLDLAATAFDLTDRGVKGRSAAKALDALVFPERGVYRSGETVFVTALLRDSKGVAATGLPLTLVAKRPDGVEYKRALVEDQGMGGRAFSLALQAGVSPGTWKIQAYADPKSPAIGEATFLVEDYVPERLDFTLKPKTASARSGEHVEINAEARYLYGAPGADLEIDGEVTIQASATNALPALKGYESGLTDESFESVKGELEQKETTDAKGKAVVKLVIPEINTPRSVEAKVLLRVGEPGGRAVERSLTIPILSKGGVIGVKKNFEDGSLGEEATASFDVVVAGSDGNRSARKNVQWTLYRVNNAYQWYNSDGRWGYERVKSSKKIADGRIDVDIDKAGHIQVPVSYGAHRLELRTESGGDGPTAISFNVGWSGDASADTPDLLEVTLDKASYKVGEEMKLAIQSRFAGKATLAIAGDALNEVQMLDLKEGDNHASFPVKADWGAGAYAIVIAHRPLDQAAKRMPGRALGLAWFGIDEDAHKIAINIGAPDKIRPRTTMTLPIKLAGLSPGEEAEITVAAVDIGILNLTRYEAPNAKDYFFGQRQLATEIRDLYGLLIDGMQGSRGAIRMGGDAAASANGVPKPTQAPLARYSGVVKVDADGIAKVSFDLPAFNGAIRVMAVAWSKTRVGNAQADVIIRDPVVVQATLPRFLSLGDQSRFHVQIDNVEGKSGEYTVDLDLHGPVSVAADALRKTIKLEAGARTAFTIPVTSAGIGTASIDMRLTGPGVDAAQAFTLSVLPGTSELYRRTIRPLAQGESLTVSSDLIADFVPGTGSVSVAVSPIGAIDVPALLMALDRYPYGCSEQTVSRAMPLLYVNKLASLSALALDDDLQPRIKEAIDKVLTRQDSNGSFGLWAAGGDEDIWLSSFVMDFLTRSRENNFAVPQKAFDIGLDYLRNHVANKSDVGKDESSALAYAIYVLARNGRPVMGDLRYLADTKLDAFESPLARAQLAASFALLGDRARAASVFTAATDRLGTIRASRYSRSDYGTRLRDGAALMALAAESGASKADIQRAALVMEEERPATPYTSTQENAWMVLAAQALAAQASDLELDVDGVVKKGAYFRTFRSATLEARPSTIANKGAGTARIVLTTSGNPAVHEPAASQGYTLEREFFKLDGTKIDATKVKQNERFVVALKIIEPEAAYARLLLVDHLPAGLEIDNPDLVDGGSIEALAFLKKDVEPSHTEYRDDRFVAAFNRSGSDKATFLVAYIVRAVTPGHYVYPPATIEDMYRPQRFGRTGYGTLDVTEK